MRPVHNPDTLAHLPCLVAFCQICRIQGSERASDLRFRVFQAQAEGGEEGKMDADGDGKVSTEEFVQFAEKRKPLPAL